MEKQIKIESDGTAGGTKILWEDGTPVRGVRKITLELDAVKMPVVTLEVLARFVDFDVTESKTVLKLEG